MDVAAFRSRFPVLAERAYLNAGTCGPLPQAARDAQVATIDRFTDEGRGSGAYFEAWGEARSAIRERYASVLGAQPGEVALTTGTSEGLVRVLTGLDLQPGDEILTAEHEHPGLLGPLSAARRLLGVTVREVRLQSIADAAGPHTRLIACSHVAWTTGELAPPVPEGIPVLLDGAQGVGAVPVDVHALGCDFYAGPGQKWLCGPDGLGMLWIAPDQLEQLATPGPTYVNLKDPAAGLASELAPDASHHDAAAIAPEMWHAAIAAFDVLAAAGWDAIHARGAALAEDLVGRLTDAGKTVAPHGATTLTSWEEEDPIAVRDRCAAAGVIVRDLPGTPYVRASTGAWNDEGDLARLLDVLQ